MTLRQFLNFAYVMLMEGRDEAAQRKLDLALADPEAAGRVKTQQEQAGTKALMAMFGRLGPGGELAPT